MQNPRGTPPLVLRMSRTNIAAITSLRAGTTSQAVQTETPCFMSPPQLREIKGCPLLSSCFGYLLPSSPKTDPWGGAAKTVTDLQGFKFLQELLYQQTLSE